MRQDLTVSAIAPYIFNHIYATLRSGPVIQGVLEGCSGDVPYLTIDGVQYSAKEIADLELAGMIEQWNSDSETGRLNGHLLSSSSFISKTEAQMARAGLQALGHLSFKDGRFDLSDVHLLDKSIMLTKETRELLISVPMLYTFMDGQRSAGGLSDDGHSIIIASKETKPFAYADQVWLAPHVNDTIVATMVDGKEIRGVVSYVGAERMACLCPETGTVSVVEYQQIQLLRYRGQILEDADSLRFRLDGDHKLAFEIPEIVRTSADSHVYATVTLSDEKLSAGNVLFVPAKHEIEPQKAANQAQISGYAVILFYTKKKGGSNYGYLVSDYCSTPYCDLTGRKETNEGEVYFQGPSLSFPYDPNKIYVVSYTAHKTDRGELPIADRLEVIKTFPYDDYSRVSVNQDGEICTEQINITILPRFIGQDIEITTLDGETENWYLDSVDGSFVHLLRGIAERESRTLSFSEIKSVRFFGNITYYKPESGMGRLGEYWFHANDLRGDEDSSTLPTKFRAAFSLYQTHKGNYLAARDISTFSETRLSGMLCSFDGVSANNSCMIVPEADYRRQEPQSYLLAPNTDLDIISQLFRLRLSEYDYPVVYQLFTGCISQSVLIRGINERGALPKPGESLDGYLVLFISYGKDIERGFGFINPPDQLDAFLTGNDRKGKLFFRYSDLISPPAELDTRDAYYAVTYVPGQGNVAHDIQIKQRFSYPSLNRNDKSDSEDTTIEQTDDSSSDNASPMRPPLLPELSDEAKQKTKISQPQPGESLIIKLMDGSFVYGKVINRSRKSIAIHCESDNREREISEEGIETTFRFGLVTGFWEIAGEARCVINGLEEYTMGSEDGKISNVLRNQSGAPQYYLLYAWKNETITGLFRIEAPYMQLIPWRSGKVGKCDTKNKRFIIWPNKKVAKAGSCLKMQSQAEHRLTVLSDTYVSRTFRSGADWWQSDLYGQYVYCRVVSHPFLDSETGAKQLKSSAIDVHCTEEVLPIHFNEARGVYMGYYTNTEAIPIRTAESYLRAVEGREVSLHFTPDKNGTSLTASLNQSVIETLERSLTNSGLDGSEEKGNKDDPEKDREDNPASEETVRSLLDEPLARYVLAQASIPRELAKDFPVGDDGMPISASDGSRMVDYLIREASKRENNKNKYRMAAARIILAFPENQAPKGFNAASAVRTAFQRRASSIAGSANAVLAEYSLYLSVLLHYPVQRAQSSNAYSDEDCLYGLLLQDFGSGESVRERISTFSLLRSSTTHPSWQELIRQNCTDVSELVAHLLMLDKKSTEKVIKELRNNPSLCAALKSYSHQMDELISESSPISEVLKQLRERYDQLRRIFQSRFLELMKAIRPCDELIRIVDDMGMVFLRLICREDAENFTKLRSACAPLGASLDGMGFADRERILSDAYRSIGDLERSIRRTPGRESLELLLLNEECDLTDNILTRLKREILGRINQLYYPGTLPQITCECDTDYLLSGARDLYLIIRNGSEGSMIRTAENITLHLECESEGVYNLPAQIRIPKLQLPAGEECVQRVDVSVETDNPIISIACQATYSYNRSFDNGNFIKETATFDLPDIQPEIRNDPPPAKNKNAINPYRVAAKGHPLKVGDEMFYGREPEKKLIWDSIRRYIDGRSEFIPGSAVIIYGQKKCGKTSLVNSILNEIQTDSDLRKRAIIVEFPNIYSDVLAAQRSLLPSFGTTFRAMLLARFFRAVHFQHRDLEGERHAAGLKKPDVLSPEAIPLANTIMEDFFDSFNELDRGRHQVVLLMDEFTNLVVNIVKEEESGNFGAKDTLNFMKTYSQPPFSFVQVIIGHLGMISGFDKLNMINHTVEFATRVPVAALDEIAARQLIRVPMKRACGLDVYDTSMGERAIARLLDLSGRHPTYLMRLCDRMFEFYMNPDCHAPYRTKIYDSDVDSMVQAYAGELRLNDDFDILFTEDGDESGKVEDRRTYNLLIITAQHTERYGSSYSADAGNVRREYDLIHDGKFRGTFDETRNILERRNVIDVKNGRIHIKTGLFVECARQKNGRTI